MDTPPRALVVDDDTVSRLVLAHMLRRLGWDVIEADDLGPAVVAAVTRSVSVVFCDYWMDTGNGLELLTVLSERANRPAFVLVTGSVEHVDIELEDGVKVDAHLTKPISTRSLNECLRRLRAAGALRLASGAESTGDESRRNESRGDSTTGADSRRTADGTGSAADPAGGGRE